MIDPITDFLKEPEAKEFADMVNKPAFKKACVYALAQYAMDMPSTTNAAASWDNASRMNGAKAILHTLEFLVNPVPKRTLPNKNLLPT